MKQSLRIVCSDNNVWIKWPLTLVGYLALDPIYVTFKDLGHRLNVRVDRIKNVSLSALNACYEMTYLGLFVEFFMLKRSRCNLERGLSRLGEQDLAGCGFYMNVNFDSFSRWHTLYVCDRQTFWQDGQINGVGSTCCTCTVRALK